MIGLGVALFMALVCILFHFEALVWVEKSAQRMPARRSALLITWGGLFTAHVLQIWLYALVYQLVSHYEHGELTGAYAMLDYAYFSAVVYTTLGFGDMLPVGELRMVAGSEALVGLCLIAWSATVTFAVVRNWED